MVKKIEITGIVKICPKCGLEKDLCEFGRLNRWSNIYQHICNICRTKERHKKYDKKNKDKRREYIKKYSKEYNIKNKEVIKIKNKKYKEDNKERLKIYSKEYVKKNKDLINEKRLKRYHKNKLKIEYKAKKEENKEKNRQKYNEYYYKNREKIKEKNKKRLREYYLKNSEILKTKSKNFREANKDKLKEIRNTDKCREQSRKYSKKRRELGKITEYVRSLKKDSNFKIRQLIAARVSSALKYKNNRKSNKTIVLLGCSIPEFKQYIELQFTEGMCWENRGYNGWHLDHIIPCAMFDLSIEENQRICFNYRNLRPLWGKDNIKKRTSIPENVFEKIYEITEILNLKTA